MRPEEERVPIWMIEARFKRCWWCNVPLQSKPWLHSYACPRYRALRQVSSPQQYFAQEPDDQPWRLPRADQFEGMSLVLPLVREAELANFQNVRVPLQAIPIKRAMILKRKMLNTESGEWWYAWDLKDYTVYDA